MSNKLANFSFVGELPTYKTPRHCFGYISLSNLYHVLTGLLIVQLIMLLLFGFLPSLANARDKFLTPGIIDGDRNLKDLCPNIFMLVTVVWMIFITISLIGNLKNCRFLHFPLVVLEACFCVAATAGGIFLIIFVLSFDPKKQKTTNDFEEAEALKYRLPVLLALVLFHAHYFYVLFCVQADLKTRRETDEFIARQQMFDEVCEEMAWEEEEAEKYRGLPMSGNYFPDSSYTDESSCNIYEDIGGWLPDRRCVTFFDGSP